MPCHWQQKTRSPAERRVVSTLGGLCRAIVLTAEQRRAISAKGGEKAAERHGAKTAAIMREARRRKRLAAGLSWMGEKNLEEKITEGVDTP